MIRREIVVLIPALNPQAELIRLMEELRRAGFDRRVVVNDGSPEEYDYIFAELAENGCVVARHKGNRGKGAALKTGIRAAIESYGRGQTYITADADGQHLAEDIVRIAETLMESPGHLVLGIRNFDEKNVPFRSRLGNRFSSAFFRLANGTCCPDTQTGLRGIPACLEELALREEGDRYEYEMHFLADAVKKAPMSFVPIQTVYQNGNESSHFRPVADSLRVYGRPLRFAGASLAGAAVDYLVFYILCSLLILPQGRRIAVATVAARMLSGAVNFYLNRRWSFRSRRSPGGEALRYGVLFLGIMGASACLVACLSILPWPILSVKLLVDGGLYVISYIVQKNWVFRKEAME